MDRMQDEFPNAKNTCYLNSAAQGLLPQSAVRAIHEAAQMQVTPQSLGDSQFYELPARCRGLVAELLHCSPEEVAITSSTGYGLAAIALSLPLSPGDEVLLTERDFPSNMFAWEALRARGIRIRTAPFAPDGSQTSRVLESIRPETRALSLSAVHFYTGYRYDLPAISSFCRSRDIFLVVDAAHAAGCIDLNLGETHVDAVSAPGHKWQLGPNGTGFLYVHRELLPRLNPAFTGWMSNAAATRFAEMQFFGFSPAGEARRFELGSTPYILLSAYEIGLKLLRDSRMPLIEKHNLALATRIRQSFDEVGWKVCGTSLPSVIVSAKPPEKYATAELHRALLEKQIYISLREGHLRVSPHLYNSTQDVERLFAELKQLL